MAIPSDLGPEFLAPLTYLLLKKYARISKEELHKLIDDTVGTNHNRRRSLRVGAFDGHPGIWLGYWPPSTTFGIGRHIIRSTDGVLVQHVYPESTCEGIRCSFDQLRKQTPKSCRRKGSESDAGPFINQVSRKFGLKLEHGSQWI